MTILVDAGSLICSGAAIDLQATEHTATMNAFWNVPSVPGRSTGSSYNWRLAEGQYSGIANPGHQITGVYDTLLNAGTNKTNLTDNGAYFVTGSMLAGIMMSGSVFALIDDRVNTISEYGSGSMVYVAPISFKILRPNTSRKSSTRGYILDYSLDMIEVKV